MRAPSLLAALLLATCFSWATYLVPWFQSWAGRRAQSATLLTALMGDSRRLFADHFFVKADAYFHSGYYPTIFDRRESFETSHLAEDAGALNGQNKGEEAIFLGEPLDWIDRFSRHFFPSVHTHLDEGGPAAHSDKPRAAPDAADVREILPWLRLSAELDPNRVETYTVAAFWLRTRLGKVRAAEEFLLEGLRANPGNYAILFELGRIYDENRQDAFRARNVWEQALQNWHQQEANKPQPDHFMLEQIAVHLAQLEEKEGNFARAINFWEMVKGISPNPQEIQKRIDEVRQRIPTPARVAPP